MSKYLLPVVYDWADWSSIYTNVALWRPVIERIMARDETVASVGVKWPPVDVVPGFPGTCAVFAVDKAAVFKIFPPMVARDFDRERSVYRLLHDHVPYRPVLLAHGILPDRIEWPYLVTSFIPGEAWRDVRNVVPRAQALAVMRELGRTVRGVHDTPLPENGSWPSSRAWDHFIDLRLPRIGTDLRGQTSLPEPVIAEIERLVENTNWHTTLPCLVHADLTEDHLLLGNTGGRWAMAGLIDWADAEVCDPLYDWVALWFSICRRDAGLLVAFQEGYGGPNAFDAVPIERLAAFTFLHRFAANIVSEILTPVEQRAILSLELLLRRLYGGLPGYSTAT